MERQHRPPRPFVGSLKMRQCTSYVSIKSDTCPKHDNYNSDASLMSTTLGWTSDMDGVAAEIISLFRCSPYLDVFQRRYDSRQRR